MDSYSAKDMKLITLEHIYPTLPESFRSLVPWSVVKMRIEAGSYTLLASVLRDEENSDTQDDIINMEYAALILSATSTTSLSELILSYRANE